MLGNQQRHSSTQFLHLAKSLSHVMDPWREGSIASIACSSDGLHFWHKLPFEKLLDPADIEHIYYGEFDKIPAIFHNLSADSNQQKSSFRKGLIMLNSWELVCMIMCKHMNHLPSVNSFFQLVEDMDIHSVRLDDSRLSLIIFTKLLEYVQYKKVDPETMISMVEVNRYKELAESTVLIMDLFFLSPVIKNNSDCKLG